MSLTELQYDTLYNNPANATNRQKRKAHWELFKRWTGNTILYFIKTTDVFTEAQKGEIQKAIDEIEKTTCLKCNSHLGMTGGEQAINLHPNCRVKPTILHEFGHALGLVHEHQLPDRDEYLNILYENVEPDWAIWFKRIESNLVLQYEVPYDYRSIMHYGITAFSANGKQTIQAKDITKGHLIQDTWDKASFSFSDVKVINSHYECSSHCPETVKNKCPQPDSFLNKNCRCEFAYGRETDPLTGTEIVEAGPTTAVPCYDKKNFCQELARGGACNTDPGYMLQNCQEVLRSLLNAFYDYNHDDT
ncbi:zinc metalloproteinase nas-1-like [Tubulanus polymorphus]|uniref:zinc metalloproteinase nas-1-like n=1 Tax=Tubulanus polymorphus TaxID=672921 RepID=UPI003DA6736E